MTRTKVKVNSSFWVRPLRSVDSAGYLLDYSHSLLCLWCLDAVIVCVGVGTCVFRSTDLVKVKWSVVAAKRPATTSKRNSEFEWKFNRMSLYCWDKSKG